MSKSFIGKRIAAVLWAAGLLAATACPVAAAAARPGGAFAGPWSPRFVAAGPVPAPDDTIHVVATVPYLGVAGTGRAYVALAPGHTAIENPVVVVEGFDLDNSMDWDELYTLLNQENLLEDLRTAGYDAIVLDFTEAADYIQRNAFVFTELLAQVTAGVAPDRTVAVVGASMGGLVARYGLAWLEQQGIPHRTRLFVSYDAPHRGANIPLGLQHWTEFFAGQAADAAFFRDRLNTPAARQMLVYHFGRTAGQVAAPDSLFAALQDEFAALGGWPQDLRRVAVSNGSGAGLDQGYAAGAQLIQYSYSSLLVTILGNVWALPAGGTGTVFDGRIRIILVQDTRRTVTVSGTLPYDNAPGGWRASMTQLDTTAVDYGDIVALHANHCFVPTVSALALDGLGLFHDVAAEPDPVSLSPFHALYWAASNEEHVAISAATAQALRAEIAGAVVAAGDGREGGSGNGPPIADGAPVLAAAAPNPFRDASRIAFTLPRDGALDAAIFAADGRRVRVLARGRQGAGSHALSWDGRDDAGRSAAPGLYFVRVALDGRASTGRLVRLP